VLAQETFPLDKLIESITGGATRLTASLTTSLTDDLAKKIVNEAAPVTRNLVNEERNRLADAALQGLPFFVGGAFTAIGTMFLLPPGLRIGKAVGYAASTALLGFGAYSVLSKVSTKAPAQAAPAGPAQAPAPSPAPAAPSLPSLPSIDTAALKAEMSAKIVKDSEPFIRQLVQDERMRLGNALEAGIPFHIAAALSFVGTLFLVPAGMNFLKAAGYSAAATLAGIGFWRTFGEMRSAK